MEIRINETGQVMTESEFRSLFPDTSFPQQLTGEIIESFGATAILEGPQASPTRYQVAFRDGVEEINGKWFTKYSVSDMDQEAIDALDTQQKAAIREERNKRLAETDWLVVKAMEEGVPLDTEWAAYRKFLRDITHEPGFPWETPWPNKPE